MYRFCLSLTVYSSLRTQLCCDCPCLLFFSTYISLLSIGRWNSPLGLGALLWATCIWYFCLWLFRTKFNSNELWFHVRVGNACDSLQLSCSTSREPVNHICFSHDSQYVAVSQGQETLVFYTKVKNTKKFPRCMQDLLLFFFVWSDWSPRYNTCRTHC